jgi:N-sulfoglucosamine sulfohydrolase
MPHHPTQPNLLWITAEDICPNLGCYGDPNASTPHLDRFARAGVRFSQVFSVHPCCSPSRSCLATGIYPTRLGTFQHRSRMWVDPRLVRCFPTLLRDAGYYTFNGCQGGRAKLDYNFEPADQPWDKIGSQDIEWRNRAAGQPFFGQVNLFRTHQSQYGQRKVGEKDAVPAPCVHDPSTVTLPPYLPATPAAREIWAEYHDRISEMDAQFGALLEMLERDGLAEDTIVFFFGDNGHGVPGGKVWLWNEGLHVPLLIRFPARWAHLAPAMPGSVCDRLTSFLDFAPSMLALADVPIPGAMQGLPFLAGPAAQPRASLFAARDFHDNADFDTSRAVRDARFHYIRNFMPHQGWDAILYSWEKAPYLLDSWRLEAGRGALDGDSRQAGFFRRTKPVEELYDVAGDPWQMNNLAGNPRYQADLQRLRADCEAWMISNGDLGLLSQYELYTRAEADSPHELAVDPVRNPVGRLLHAAGLAGRREADCIPELRRLLADADSALRRWGALGLLGLGSAAAAAADALLVSLSDPAPDVRMTSAEALCALHHDAEAVPVLIGLLTHESRIIRNETLLALCRIGPVARAALPHLSDAEGPSRHTGLWSYDDIKAAISLARSCLSDEAELTRDGVEPPPTASHPVAASARLRATREKCLP